MYQYGALAAITLLAVLLRFYKLGEWSFWIDEILTLNNIGANYPTISEILQNIPPSRIWFSLSLILSSGAAAILGVSEWSGRIIPAIIGILSIPALYFPVKGIFGSRVGLITVLLLAVSPWHIYWSQNARFYTSLMLFYSLALLSLYLGLERDNPKYLFAFIIFFYLALSERLFAFFIVPVVASYLALLTFSPLPKPPGLNWRNLLIVFSPLIVFLIYEGYTLIRTGSSMIVYAMPVFWGKPIDSPIRLLVLIVFNFGVPLVAIALFGCIYFLLRKSRSGLFFFTGAVIPVVILVALNPFTFTVDRYVFVALPSWIILGALTVNELVRNAQGSAKILAIGVLFLLIADAAGANLMYYQLNNGNRLDWRGAMRYVRDNKMEGDLVVATRKHLGQYYLGEDVVDWKDFDPDLKEDLDKRIWFIIDSEGVWHGSKADLKQDWLEENAQLLQFWYLRVREQINLRIFMFDPLQKVAN